MAPGHLLALAALLLHSGGCWNLNALHEEPTGQLLLREATAPPPVNGCWPRPRPWPRGCLAVGDDDWLRKWLASLEVLIPTTSTSVGGFDITVSDGLCRHFEIDEVYSIPQADFGLSLGAKGIHVFCQLHWQAKAPLLPGPGFSGEVRAEVANSSAGGPIRLAADNGNPPLPAALKTSDCASDIRVVDLQFSGGPLAGLLHLLRGLIRRIVNSALDKALCKNLDALLEQRGSAMLQRLNSAARAFLAAPPRTPERPLPLPQPQSDFLVLAENPGLQALRKLVDGALGNASSAFNAKSLLTLLLGRSGHFDAGKLGLLPLDRRWDIDGLGKIKVSVKDLQVDGLNGVSQLALDLPQPRQLGLALGFQGLAATVAVRLEVVPSVQGPLQGQNLTETFTLSAGVGEVSLSASLFAAVNGSLLGDYAFEQLASGGCLAAAAQQLLLTEAGLGLQDPAVRLQPGTAATLERDLDNLLNRAVAMLAKQFAPALAAAAKHFANVALRDLGNEALAGSTKAAYGEGCPAPTATYSFPRLSAATALMALLLLAAPPLGALGWTLKQHRDSKRARAVSLQLGSRTESSSEAVTCRERATSSEAVTCLETPGLSFVTCEQPASSPGRRRSSPLLSFTEEEGNEAGGSSSSAATSWDGLAWHPRTPRFMRWLLPCLLLGNIMLFLSANAAPGVRIMLHLFADGEPVAELPPLKEYTLVSSVRDMANARVYALAVLIVLFSGCWPYAKLLLMFGCWLAPTRLLSVRLRQRCLFFLDAYGKWSLVDLFVMVIMMVAFSFNLEDQKVPLPLLPDLFASVGASFRLLVAAEPAWGIYAFLLATLLSLILGHALAGCHRYAHQLCEYGAVECGGVSRLCDKMRPEGARGLLYVLTPAVSLGIATVLVVAGILVDSFQFTFQGLSGLLLGEEGRVRGYSVVGLAMAIPGSQLDETLWGPKLLMASFLLFTVVLALAYPVLLSVLWTAKLNERAQRLLLVTASVLRAWSSLEVLVLALGAGVLEIERFALAVLGHACDPINRILEKSPSLVARMHGRATCFDVTTELRAGFWLLLVAVVVEMAAGSLVLRRCERAFCGGR